MEEDEEKKVDLLIVSISFAATNYTKRRTHWKFIQSTKERKKGLKSRSKKNEKMDAHQNY